MKFEQKNKHSIKYLFNQIAKNYDKLNEYMSLGLQKFIKQNAVKNVVKKYNDKPQRIFDLCSGTGDIAMLLEKYYPDAKIFGVDFSSEMLEIARQRSKKITFIEKDITNLGIDEIFKENEFDICFIGFGLRNLPDIDEFLENIKFYIKKGGVLSILDLGKPNLLMKPYFYLHYQIFIPLIAFIFNKDAQPYKYFVNSAKTYPSQKEMLKKLKEHGYVETKNKNFLFGIISQQMGVKK